MLMITFSGTALLWTVVAMGVGLVGLIALLRHRFQSGKSVPTTFMQKKSPSADVFRFSGTFFRIGLVMVLAFSIMAFNWTLSEPTATADGFTVTLEEDIMIAPPPTDVKPPPPPPPPPPKIEAVEEDELLEDEVFESNHIDDKTEFTAPPPAPVAPTPAYVPPPPVVEPTQPEFFTIVEDMPCFGKKCTDDALSRTEKRTYSDQQLVKFMNKHLRYPALARENGVEGRAVVRFVVEEDGRVTDIEVLRDPGGGLGKEAARVIALMNEEKHGWIAGRQLNKKVRVQYNLPVTFGLD